LLVCQADADVIRARLAARSGDVSDADWAIHLQAAKGWVEPSADTRQAICAIATGGTSEQAAEDALAALRAIELAR
jgi:predicted kinase